MTSLSWSRSVVMLLNECISGGVFEGFKNMFLKASWSLKRCFHWALCQGCENGVFGKTVFLSPTEKQLVLTKNGENDDLHSTHKNKGLCFSEPGNRRKWRKWRVSLRQNQGLPKTGFSPPWLCTRTQYAPFADEVPSADFWPKFSYHSVGNFLPN